MSSRQLTKLSSEEYHNLSIKQLAELVRFHPETSKPGAQDGVGFPRQQPTAAKRQWTMERRVAMRDMVSEYHQVEVSVVLVKAGETKEQAWQRYLGEHPACNKDCVRIFHFVSGEAS